MSGSHVDEVYMREEDEEASFIASPTVYLEK